MTICRDACPGARAFGVLAALLVSTSLAGAQETAPPNIYGDMSLVTQDLLNVAAGDGKNFRHTNG
jgi:hypothetical protein